MIRNIPPILFRIATLAVILCLPLVWGCASTAEKRMEQLGKVLRVYNNAFESRSENGGSGYVQNEYRMDYLLKYGAIQSRVSFFKSQMLNQAYFKDGKPLEINADDPEEDFDEVVITMRYQVTISPSNQLKIFLHDQRWKHNGATWRLEPNLTPFLK